MTSHKKIKELEERLANLGDEKLKLEESKAKIEPLKADYLERRAEAKKLAREAMWKISRLRDDADAIIKVENWELFFTPYEQVIIRWAGEGWFVRILQFLAGGNGDE